MIITLSKGSYVPVFELPKTAPHPAVVVPSQKTIAVKDSSRRQWVAMSLAIIVAFTAVLLYSTRPNTSSSAVLRPLASLPGIKGPPSLSADGTLVVFFWSGAADKPAPGLYIKAVDGEDLRRLTTADPTSEPAWSPLGSEIAFSRSGPDGGVFVVSQVGGPERKISDSGSAVTWTPDGTAVLFRDAFQSEKLAGALRQGIFSVSLKTLEKRQH